MKHCMNSTQIHTYLRSVEDDVMLTQLHIEQPVEPTQSDRPRESFVYFVDSTENPNLANLCHRSSQDSSSLQRRSKKRSKEQRVNEKMDRFIQIYKRPCCLDCWRTHHPPQC